MAAKKCIRETNDTKECNKVKDMPFNVTDEEKAAILESIPQPVVLLDTDLKVMWSNDAMNKMFNLNAGELSGRYCFEKMHGQQKPCRVCPVVKAINTGQPCIVDDLSLLGKRWMLGAYPLRNGEGNITRVVQIATDITESKQAEKKFNKVRKLQSVILDNSTVGIAFVRNRIHEWVNPRLCEIYGIPQKQLEGSSTRITYPDDESFQRTGNEIYSLFARGEKATLELHMRRGDGSLFWCRLEGMVLDASKPHEGSIWIVEDITKRKQSEEDLQKLSRLQSVILDNSSVGIAFVRNRNYEWVNRKMSELFGIPVEQLQGSSTRIIYPDEAIFNSLGSEGYSLLAQGKKASLETYLRKGDGSLFWCRLEGIVLDPSHPQDGSIWIFEDITERKQAQEALEKRIMALTNPLDDIKNIVFEDLFNISDLQSLQDMLAESWGVGILLTRPDGAAITQPSNFTYFCSEFIRKNEKGRRNCLNSDAELGRYNPSGPTIQKCLSAGLWGAGASITVGGRHVANWLIGQVRNEAQSEEQIIKYAREIGADEEAFREAFLQVPVMSQQKFDQIAHTLFSLADQLSNRAYQNIQQARFIVERMRAEEALRESERKLSEAQSIAQLGYWKWDLGTGNVEWSEEVFKIFQLDPNSFSPQIDSIMALSPWPEDHERNKELIQRAIESRERGTYEQRFLRPDKSTGYYMSSYHGVYDDKGDLVSIVGTVQDITERKQAEEDLRRSEEKFRGIYEESPLGIELYDREGILLDANKACLGIFGISDAKTLTGLNLFDNPNLREKDKAQLRRGKSVRYEMLFDFEKVKSHQLYETIKKGIIYIDVLITPLKNATKESDIGYLVHTRDITKRKLAEEALRESETKYRRLHESMTEAFASVDMKGRIQEFNRSFQSMLGYSEEELRHLTYLDITPKKWQALEKRIIEEQILAGFKAESYEKELQRKDGTVFPVELNTFLMRDDAGNPIGMWAIVHDITERKKIEAELRATKDYLSTVFNNVYDAIIVHDLDGMITDVNEKMLEMYKVTREEAIGFNVMRDYSVTDESIEESRNNWNKVLSGENIFIEWKARRPKDGSLFDVEVFLTGVKLLDGDYILVNVRDITDRKQMEEEHQKIEARMREVQKLESLGVLAGGIAHDFNNLLMAILGRADLALFSLSETSPAYQHVEEITRASHRAADLCRQMLAYSGKGRFVIGRFDISEIVREMGQMLNVSISKNAMVRYSLAEGLPPPWKGMPPRYGRWS